MSEQPTAKERWEREEEDEGGEGEREDVSEGENDKQAFACVCVRVMDYMCESNQTVPPESVQGSSQSPDMVRIG